MRKTLLAFFGLAFAIYWISTAELPGDQPASLAPVMPSLVRLAQRLPAKIHSMPSNPSQPAEFHDLQIWLDNESAAMGRIDPHPEKTKARLESRAKKLQIRQLRWLKSVALNSSLNGDRRFLAVYLIGLSEREASRDLLKDIGLSGLPGAANDRAYSDEVIIRSQALEAAAKRLPAAEAKRYLRQVLRQSAGASIARHAEYLLHQLR
jgi:hypothetical protein